MHGNLTLGVWKKFLRRMLGMALIVAAVSTVAAQDESNLNDYLGPGVLNRGAGAIGTSSGEQLDLRYYAGVSGIVDTNLQPFAVDAHGNLVRIHNLWGAQVSGGVYGVHHWKLSQLGLDYAGDYHRYANSNVYNGSDQHLTLGYTLEASRRWILDLKESAATFSTTTNYGVNKVPGDLDSGFTPATVLFDSRTTLLNSSAYATYLQSARNSFTIGATGFLQDQQSVGLGKSFGYSLLGSMQRRMSKTTTIGANYNFSHYEFPALRSSSDSNSYHGTLATGIGRFWTFSFEGGVSISAVNSQQSLALNPELAALLGQSTVTLKSYSRTIFPSGSAILQRKFRRASLAFNYSRAVSSGNGVVGTSRLDGANVSLSYTAASRLNFGVGGGYYGLVPIGENTGRFATYSGGMGLTYTIGHGINATARYDLNQVHAELDGFRRTSTRATLGLMFSPGTRPLSLW